MLGHFSLNSRIPNENRQDEKNEIDDIKQESEINSMDNVEYVFEQLDVKDTGLEAFSDVFARFQLPPDESEVNHCFMI